MKKKLLFIVFISGLSFCFIIVLFSLSGNSVKPNPFERIFTHNFLHLSNVLEMKNKDFYIAGSTSNYIYLGSYNDRLKLLLTDTKLADTTPVYLVNTKRYKLKAAKVLVDSPNFFLSDNIAHKLYTGKLSNGRFRPLTGKPVFLAGNSVPISESSFAIRTWKDSLKELELAKQTSSPPYLSRAPELLEKQIDGVFCTDGILYYNKNLKMIIYTYYYRNEFICVDTSMQLLYRGNTLDTVSKAGIHVTEVKSASKTTTSAPRKVSNSGGATFGPWLFNRSKLMARNEEKKQFLNASVIDAYDLTNYGRYMFSFYLPKYKKHKAREFRVFENYIIALYDRYVVVYDVENGFFSQFQPANL